MCVWMGCFDFFVVLILWFLFMMVAVEKEIEEMFMVLMVVVG